VNLAHFAGIVPCGIGAADGTVTSLQAELGREIGFGEVKALTAKTFARLFPHFLNTP